MLGIILDSAKFVLSCFQHYHRQIKGLANEVVLNVSFL